MLSPSVATHAACAAAGLAVGVAAVYGQSWLQRLVLPPGLLVVIEQWRSSWTADGLRLFARLGVADVLAAGPRAGMSAEAIAAEIQADASSLQRLLRLCASITEVAPVTMAAQRSGAPPLFRLTAAGRSMVTNAPMGVRHAVTSPGLPWQARSRLHVFDAIKTGKPAFTFAWKGCRTFTEAAQLADKQAGEPKTSGPCIDIPSECNVFDAAMSECSSIFSPLIAGFYNWSRFERVADVGGGTGSLLRSILKYHPKIKQAISLDLPAVVEACPADSGHPALTLARGNFFEPMPEINGCDAIIMRHVLHDWSDEQCAEILSHVRMCLTPRAKLVVAEMVVGSSCMTVGRVVPLAMDMEMLSVNTGRERTRSEWKTLLEQAGFQSPRFIHIGGSFHLIEATPCE